MSDQFWTGFRCWKQSHDFGSPCSIMIFLIKTPFCFQISKAALFWKHCYKGKICFWKSNFWQHVIPLWLVQIGQNLSKTVKTCPNWSKFVQTCSFMRLTVLVEKFTFENKFDNTTSYLFEHLTQTARPKFLYQKKASEPAL